MRPGPSSPSLTTKGWLDVDSFRPEASREGARATKRWSGALQGRKPNLLLVYIILRARNEDKNNMVTHAAIMTQRPPYEGSTYPVRHRHVMYAPIDKSAIRVAIELRDTSGALLWSVTP